MENQMEHEMEAGFIVATALFGCILFGQGMPDIKTRTCIPIYVACYWES